MVDGAEYARFENVLTLTDTPLPATPDKVDYTFKEWTPKWAPKVSQDMVYECVWAEDFNNDEIDDSTQEHFTVTYTDGVDGEEVFKDVVFTDVLVNLPVPSFGANPERKNYIFNGWAPELKSDDKVTADITYVAQWLEDFNNDGIDDATQAHYTVTYSDGAGGEVFADEVYKDVLVDTATPAFMGDVTRKGYLFNGWDKAVAKTVTGDVTYTATWLRDENENGIEDDKEIYTITLDYGYDNKVQTITAKYGDIITIPDPGTRYGYNFVYWQGSVYYPGDLYRVTENHVLSAIWDAKDVEIVIPGQDPIPGKFGEEIEIPSTVPTAPEGYEFAGWQLDDGRIVMPGDKLLIDFESMNFSPIWKKVENKSGATTKAGGVQTSVAGASTWMGAMGLASLGLLKKRKDEE